MNNRRLKSGFRTAGTLALLALCFAGCRRSLWHDQGCGAAYQHEPIYWEHPFYGYNPTCWQQWPAGWVGCPTVCLDPHPPAGWEALPPATEQLPPGISPVVPGDVNGPMIEAPPQVPPAAAPLPEATPPAAIPPSSRAPTNHRSAAIRPPESEEVATAAQNPPSAPILSQTPEVSISTLRIPSPRAGTAPPKEPLTLRLQPSRKVPALSAPTPPSLAEVLGPERAAPRRPIESAAPAPSERSSETRQSSDQTAAANLLRPVAFGPSQTDARTSNSATQLIPAVTQTPRATPANPRVPRLQPAPSLNSNASSTAPRDLTDILAVPEVQNTPADDWLDLTRTRTLTHARGRRLQVPDQISSR